MILTVNSLQSFTSYIPRKIQLRLKIFKLLKFVIFFRLTTVPTALVRLLKNLNNLRKPWVQHIKPNFGWFFTPAVYFRIFDLVLIMRSYTED